MTKLNVLDLFSGLGGWSQAFVERGHSVTTIDILPKFKPTVVTDIMGLKLDDFIGCTEFDIILASPPCNNFSVASVYLHWTKGRPNPETKESIKLVAHTLDLILNLYPKFWILENPRGMLRRVLGLPTTTITQCQYDRPYMKPTDLWGVLPKSFKAKSCKNRDTCHELAPRSSQKGLQRVNAFQQLTHGKRTKNGELQATGPELRAKIPHALSLAMCLACEKG